MEISQEQLGYLKQLQEQDRLLMASSKEKEEAPALIEKLDLQVAEAQREWEAANTSLEDVELAEMQLKEDVDEAKQRLERAKEKLQNITNEVEYKAATKESEQISEIIKTKTAEIPAALENVNKAKEFLAQKEQILNVKREARRVCPEDLDELVGQINGKIDSMSAERAAVADKIDKGTLAIYEKVLATRGGIALAAAEGGSCRACNVKIRAQLYNQILQGKLEECQTCRRLLYAG